MRKILTAAAIALALVAGDALAEFGSNRDRGYGGFSSGPSGRSSDSGWTWSFSEWSDDFTGQGSRRGRITAREVGADEIDRANRLGHGQGGPSGADHGGTHGLGRDRSSVN